LLDPGEQCDDDNTESGDGCSETCTAELDYVCTGEPSVCEEHGFTCVEQNIGHALGSAVATGDTRFGDDDLNNFCNAGAKDDIILWTAPEAGTYQFDLRATSYYDTVIGLFSGCTSAVLTCNDDTGTWDHSQVTWTFEAGESVLIVADGYYYWSDAEKTGPWQLDIARIFG